MYIYCLKWTLRIERTLFKRRWQVDDMRLSFRHLKFLYCIWGLDRKKIFGRLWKVSDVLSTRSTYFPIKISDCRRRLPVFNPSYLFLLHNKWNLEGAENVTVFELCSVKDTEQSYSTRYFSEISESPVDPPSSTFERLSEIGKSRKVSEKTDEERHWKSRKNRSSYS